MSTPNVSTQNGDWAEVVDKLVAEKIASRIAGKDATIWGPDAEPEASIRLGWVDLHDTSRPLLAEIEALQADLRSAGLDRIVLSGMGGSSLAPEVVREVDELRGLLGLDLSTWLRRLPGGGEAVDAERSAPTSQGSG